MRRGRRRAPSRPGRSRRHRAHARRRAAHSYRSRPRHAVAQRPRRRDRADHPQRRADRQAPRATMSQAMTASTPATAAATAPAGERLYFTVLLDQAKADLAARGQPVYDFGVGDPIEPTPEFIRQTLIETLNPVSQYPTIVGQRRLR